MEQQQQQQNQALLDAQAAAVMGMEMPPFEALLGQLMSAANEQRGQAEAIFQHCKDTRPDALVLKLAQALQSAQLVEVRGISAVLLRKLLTKDETMYGRLAPATQVQLKGQLLMCVQGEEAKTILKKLCDTVGELGALLVKDGLWPELLPFMFQCVSSANPRLQECALLMFAHLAQYMGPQLGSHLSTLHHVFEQCLASTTSSDVRVSALRATTSFIQTLESSQDRDTFQNLLPAMMQTLSMALNSHEEVIAQEALEMFIEVAGTEPRFFRRQLPDVVNTMMQIAEAESLEEGTRHLAIEFLVTLAEARERAPGMVRKLPQMISRLFATLVKLLLEIDDLPAWHEADTEEDDAGETADYEVGQECLDRLAISLGGNTILPVASSILPHYIADQDWKHRHAALITLAQIAEGCAKVMTKNLEPVVSMILSAFQDPHPRVRWAAINAIGQLSTDLGPELQNKYHREVLPALVRAMDDFQNPRVQAHAAAAILNFSESSHREILTPYLDGIISKLLVLLQNGKRMVQEGALTALASVADSAQTEFQKYYDVVMPYLKAILVGATDKSTRMLRAKSMECISLVGMAVGKDKFREDAKQVMDVLMSLQGAQLEDDDPTTSYMLQAWARLCKCLGQEFLPYMQVVMPPLLRSAQLKPDVTITDADSDEDPNISEDDDSIETITIGYKKIGIRTSVLEEKATACNMLCCYADELKEGFYPWIEAVAPILVPLLKFYFHEDVRKAAVSAMPELLRAGKLAVEKGQAPGRDQSYVKQLTDYIVPPLIEALHKEPETELCSSMLDSINECIQLVGPLLDEAQIKSIVEEFKQVLTASSTRKRERAERSKAEDFDAEERELLHEENEQEEEVFDQVAECIGTMIKTYKASFLLYFDELLPFIMPMLTKERTAEERRIAICVFDDVVEQCGEAALKYYDTFLPFMLEAATDANPDVRQASVYGIGVCAEFGGIKFKPVVGEALERLNAVVSHPAARTQENVMATDNAVSALGKICQFQRDSIDASQVVPAWLGCLPLKGDLVEAKIVHEQLCTMVENWDPQLLGPNNQFLPKIVSVFAEVLSAGNELSNEQTTARMVSLLRHLQQTLPPPALATTWSALQPQQQAALQSILASR